MSYVDEGLLDTSVLAKLKARESYLRVPIPGNRVAACFVLALYLLLGNQMPRVIGSNGSSQVNSSMSDDQDAVNHKPMKTPANSVDEDVFSKRARNHPIDLAAPRLRNPVLIANVPPGKSARVLMGNPAGTEGDFIDLVNESAKSLGVIKVQGQGGREYNAQIDGLPVTYFNDRGDSTLVKMTNSDCMSLLDIKSAKLLYPTRTGDTAPSDMVLVEEDVHAKWFLVLERHEDEYRIKSSHTEQK